MTWHVLRKTTATFLDERLGLAEASAQLGHASEAQTLSAYVARDRQAVFADVLEGLAGGVIWSLFTRHFETSKTPKINQY